MIRDIAIKILSLGYVCDHCLGRQFSKLSKDTPNDEKGKIIRLFLRMESTSKKTDVDQSNFKTSGKCVICENAFGKLPQISADILKKLRKIEFRSFLVGIKMSDPLVMNEEMLWDKVGMKYSEPIKSEINRELSRLIEEKTGKAVEHDRPDILVIFDVQKNKTEIFSNPLFVYGEYKKFARGLPQTSSPRFKQTVQDIIAKPLIKKTLASEHVFHALGREDKEARCLVWRPFVLEIRQPVKRKVDLAEIKKSIDKHKGVTVRNLKFSDKKEISKLKSKRPYKIYRLLVDFEKPVETPEKIKKLVGVVRQRTPKKVLGLKPEKIRNKKVKSIKWKRVNNKRYRIEIKAESGLYPKELVSGDSGRTKPSVSEILGNKAKIREFDLIGLEE